MKKYIVLSFGMLVAMSSVASEKSSDSNFLEIMNHPFVKEQIKFYLSLKNKDDKRNDLNRRATIGLKNLLNDNQKKTHIINDKLNIIRYYRPCHNKKCQAKKGEQHKKVSGKGSTNWHSNHTYFNDDNIVDDPIAYPTLIKVIKKDRGLSEIKRMIPLDIINESLKEEKKLKKKMMLSMKKALKKNKDNLKMLCLSQENL